MFCYKVCADQNAPTGPDEFFPDDICREKFVVGGVSISDPQIVLLAAPESVALPLPFPLAIERKDIAVATDEEIQPGVEILIMVKKEKRNW